jgi:hypothetical protein
VVAAGVSASPTVYPKKNAGGGGIAGKHDSVVAVPHERRQVDRSTTAQDDEYAEGPATIPAGLLDLGQHVAQLVAMLILGRAR